MEYRYYIYAPIGLERKSTFCFLRYKDGKFEKYKDGAWIDAVEFISILVGENDNFDDATKDEVNELVKNGTLYYLRK